MARWTIAPSSTEMVDDVLRRLGDLALVDPVTLVEQATLAREATGPGLVAALRDDLDDALGEADRMVALLVRAVPETAEQRRAFGRRLVLASRIERRAADVADLRRRLDDLPRG